jgi:ribosomal protein L7/L12
MVQLHPFLFVIVGSFITAGFVAMARKIGSQGREIQALRGAADGTWPSPGEAVDRVVSDPVQAAKLQQAIRDGNKILAIKLYRRATGTGLRDAKNNVDRMMGG